MVERVVRVVRQADGVHHRRIDACVFRAQRFEWKRAGAAQGGEDREHAEVLPVEGHGRILMPSADEQNALFGFCDAATRTPRVYAVPAVGKLSLNRLLVSLVALLAVWLAAPTPASAQLSAAAEAQLRFSRGRQRFVAHDFAPALEEFRASRSLVNSPNTQLYIARCLRGLGRNAEALGEFQRAAAEAADRIAVGAAVFHHARSGANRVGAGADSRGPAGRSGGGCAIGAARYVGRE